MNITPSLTKFALDLHHGIVADPGINPKGGANFAVSPLAHQLLWSKTALAARGNTRTEMLDVTGLGGEMVPDGYLTQGQASMLLTAANLQMSTQAPNKIRLASSIWTQEGMSLNPEARDTFAADVQQVNFAHDPEAARKAYNAWGAAMTDGLVPNALNPGDVTVDTRLLLGATFLADLKWQESFPVENTVAGAFFLLDGTRTTHPALMSKQSRSTRSFADWQSGVTVAQFPYAGEDLSMIVITADDSRKFLELEKNLSPEQLATWLNKLGAAPEDGISVTMPKFSENYRLDLSQAYQRMGINTAYGDKADFSGLFAALPPGALKIAKTVSAGTVVNEESGTKLAEVVTNIVEEESTGPMPIELNKPFVYLIWSEQVGAPIAMGRYVTPQAD